jgi:hypothetical protein
VPTYFLTYNQLGTLFRKMATRGVAPSCRVLQRPSIKLGVMFADFNKEADRQTTQERNKQIL